MKYFIFKGYKSLYRDNEDETFDKYDKETKTWVDATVEVMDALVGFDDSEPVGSPYRYGNGDCMKEREYISEEKANEMTK